MTPSTTWQETIPPGEDDELAVYARDLAAIQARRKSGPMADRALHAKAHAGLLATLTVDDGLPEPARQGLFQRPGRYRGYLRLSNGSGARAHDKVADVRGIALKLVGVDGPKVLADATTQDFLFIDTPRAAFRSPREFVAVVKAAAGKRLLRSLVHDLGLFRTLGLVAAVAGGLKGKPNDLLDVTFHTVLPVAFGPFAARLRLVPLHAPSPRRRAGADPAYLAARIAERASQAPLRWQLEAQFFTGPQTPIEDPTVDWPSPYQRLGELETVPVAAADKAAALSAHIETLAFDPWHALAAHRPLGAMMRARKHAYFASTQGRGGTSEPDGREWERFV
jgi:hypothetical protein